MRIEIEEGSLQAGVLGLVLAVVEIVQEALNSQALRRIEAGNLDDDEIERLGSALMDLEQAVTRIKVEQNLQAAVAQIRGGLDDVVNELVDICNPERWQNENDAGER